MERSSTQQHISLVSTCKARIQAFIETPELNLLELRQEILKDKPRLKYLFSKNATRLDIFRHDLTKRNGR